MLLMVPGMFIADLVGDTLPYFVFVEVGHSAAEEWTHPDDQEIIKTLWSSHYYPNSVWLYKHDHLSPVLDAALIPMKRSAHVFVSINKMLYLYNKRWKAASMTRTFYSKIFHGYGSLGEAWRRGEKIPYQGIRMCTSCIKRLSRSEPDIHSRKASLTR